MTGKFLMQPTPDFNPSKSAKSLLRRSRQGALATLMTGSGTTVYALCRSSEEALRVVRGLGAFREEGGGPRVHIVRSCV